MIARTLNPEPGMAALTLPLDLQALWSAWGTPEFERTLAAQLQAHGHQIPLEKACENGGLPDNPRFHNFQSQESVSGTLSISFEASFRERASPGCGGIADEQTRFADFALEVSRSRCQIEHRPRRHEPEF
jgi:hypothetical protein